MRKFIFLISTLVIVGCTDTDDNNVISLIDDEEIPNEKNNTSHSIIQPGAPGEDSKTLDPVEATNIASTSYVQADVDFLQGMIVHHQQAILMSELAEERTNNQTILDLADRIDISQEDEIDFMENWLESRGENKNLSGHKHMKMAGMASSEELKELKESKSTSFDKIFLKLMINHHDGALEMVKTLKEFPGNSYDSSLDELIYLNRNKDKQSKKTQSGIHKDDILFKMNNHLIKKTGSQGQQKSFLISQKNFSQ